MNRKQRRKVNARKPKKPPKPGNQEPENQVKNPLDGEPPLGLVYAINCAIEALEKQGIRLADWENREKYLRRVVAFGSKGFYLAIKEEKGDGKQAKEDGPPPFPG